MLDAQGGDHFIVDDHQAEGEYQFQKDHPHHHTSEPVLVLVTRGVQAQVKDQNGKKEEENQSNEGKPSRSETGKPGNQVKDQSGEAGGKSQLNIKLPYAHDFLDRSRISFTK